MLALPALFGDTEKNKAQCPPRVKMLLALLLSITLL